MIDGRRNQAKNTRSAAGTRDAAHPRHGVGSRLVSLGVSADAVTVVGMVLAVATACAIGLGHLFIGAALLTAGGLMDTLDGVVAKAAGTSSSRGAFFDSVSDRIADSLIFGGVAWHLLVSTNPRWALLPIAILAVSAVVSYERAKAESLGFAARGGLMERAERLILLGIALVFHVVLLPLLAILLALTALTAVMRFVNVWVQASATVPHAGRVRPARADTTARWKSWRETGRAEAMRQRRRSRADLEPLSIRLRSVLRQDRDPDAARLRRHRSGRERAAIALRRRLDSTR